MGKMSLFILVSVSLLILTGKNLLAANKSVEAPEAGDTFIFSKRDRGFYERHSKFTATCQMIGEHAFMFAEDAHVNDVYGKEIDGVYKLFAATTRGVFVSEDLGDAWRYLSQVYELPTSIDPEHTNPLGEIFISSNPEGDMLIAGNHHGLHLSTNGVTDWVQHNSLPSSFQYHGIRYDTTNGTSEFNSSKFVAGENGLYYYDGSLQFMNKNISKGMPINLNHFASVFDMVLIPDSVLYLATEIGPFKGWINEADEFSWQPLLKRSIPFTVEDGENSDKMELTIEDDEVDPSSHLFIHDPSSGARWSGNPFYAGASGDSSLHITIDETNLYFTGRFTGDYATLDANDLEIVISTGSNTKHIERAADGTIYFATENDIFELTTEHSVANLNFGNFKINDLYLNDAELLVATDRGLFAAQVDNINWQRQTPTLSDGLGVETQHFKTSSIFEMPAGRPIRFGQYVWRHSERRGSELEERQYRFDPPRHLAEGGTTHDQFLGRFHPGRPHQRYL